MPTRFIHFCGAAGVGKKTLFHRVVENSVAGLRERFGIDDDFGAYSFYKHPGVKAMRQYVWAKENIVLHCWELSTHGWIAHNMRVHPEVEQRVYLIWQPFEIHSKNVIARAQQSQDRQVRAWQPAPAQLKKIWNDQIVPLFREVESWGQKVEVVDASTVRCDPVPVWPT